MSVAKSREEPHYRGPTYYELKAPPELDWRPFRPASYLEYRLEWDRRGSQMDPGRFPLHLDIDPTNRCNLACVMCPRTVYAREGRTAWAPRGLGDMDFALYERLVEEGAAEGLRSVKLNFLGEPLLYPKLAAMIALAAARGLYAMLNTNAVLLTPAKGRELLEAGLTDIFFSFDSPYPAEYERIRRGASFRGVLDNIRAFIQSKDEMGLKSVQTRASMVLPADGGDSEKTRSDYLRLFRDLGVAEIGFGLPTDLSRDYEPLNRGLNFSCPDLFRRAFVFWDGAVGPCCGDWERRLIMGDAKERRLLDIWGGEEYRALRAPHSRGNFREIPACRICSVPYLARAF